MGPLSPQQLVEYLEAHKVQQGLESAINAAVEANSPDPLALIAEHLRRLSIWAQKPAVGINGFGRVGRMVLRSALGSGRVRVVAINDPNLTPEYMAYLLKYDSTHGRFEGEVRVLDDSHISVDGQAVRVFGCRQPEDVAWGEADAHFVVEASGAFTSMASASAHLRGGARRVLVTAADDDVPVFVMGVNHTAIRTDMAVLSGGSFTTNALAPLAKVIHEQFGIVEALMTTVHATTAAQKTCDGPSATDWRRGRGAHENIVPAATDADAVGRVIPALAGKVGGISFCVPTPDVGVIDVTCRLRRPATYAQVCEAVREAAAAGLGDVLGYSQEPLVSADFLGDARSCVFDAQAGIALTPTFVKLICWADNEVAYAARLVDLLVHMKSIGM